MVHAYCEDLIISGQHRLRFPAIADPTPGELTNKLLSGPTISCFVLDTVESRMCGEFTLEGFQGLASLIHYSTHSAYRGLTAIRIAKQAIDWLFLWKQEGTGRPFVTTLLGMTPTTSDPSMRTAKALGFEKLFILPDAIYQADTDSYVDCMISRRTH